MSEFVSIKLPKQVLKKLEFHSQISKITVDEVAVRAIDAYDYNVMCNSKERSTQNRGKV